MALDDALLQLFDPHLSQPVLRFYGWSPPALSLGRFQKAGEVLDLDRCRMNGLPVVRRITGGGVIFHADELTYSMVCAPHQIPASNSIKDSFRILTGFLLQFYRNLGLNAGYAVDRREKGEKFGERTDFCFAGNETFDILINGRKIGGNAQRRIKHVIFQHGSIPLIGKLENAIQFLRLSLSGLEERVTCLSDESIEPDSEFLKASLKDAFCNYFGTLLLDEPPTTAEQELASRLKSDKYLNYNWNLHGEIL
jgi:lipoate-protein ligase A